MAKHTMQELYQWQALPLNIKILMTAERIRSWVNEFGEDGVYLSFSGGKDSTVLGHIIREVCGYKNIPFVFVDVPTQYPELKEFARTFDNLVILKPKISFAEVCEKYGFPLFGKEIANCIDGARRYVKWLDSKNNSNTISTDRQTIPYACYMADLMGIDRRVNKSNADYQSLQMGVIPSGSKRRLDRLNRVLLDNNGEKSQFNMEKYKFTLDAPFNISDKCCDYLKKAPSLEYEKMTKRKPILATMATESKVRTQKWLQEGCNAFDCKRPHSKPMSFWTEQDVLLYIKENNLPICSVYGDVVVDYSAMGQCENQMSFADFGILDKERPLLKTTGCQRTGCVLCGFGCHLEKEPNRFQMLKETHPKFHNLLYVLKNNGVTYAESIDWVNEHGNMNIKY